MRNYENKETCQRQEYGQERQNKREFNENRMPEDPFEDENVEVISIKFDQVCSNDDKVNDDHQKNIIRSRKTVFVEFGDHQSKRQTAETSTLTHLKTKLPADLLNSRKNKADQIEQRSNLMNDLIQDTNEAFQYQSRDPIQQQYKMIDEHPMSCPTQKTEKVQNNAKNTQSMKTPIKQKYVNQDSNASQLCNELPDILPQISTAQKKRKKKVNKQTIPQKFQEEKVIINQEKPSALNIIQTQFNKKDQPEKQKKNQLPESQFNFLLVIFLALLFPIDIILLIFKCIIMTLFLFLVVIKGLLYRSLAEIHKKCFKGKPCSLNAVIFGCLLIITAPLWLPYWLLKGIYLEIEELFVSVIKKKCQERSWLVISDCIQRRYY